MDTSIQIQGIKSQIENMKFQIDNIEIQNNNSSFMMINSIGEQLINLSLQMLNTGIRAFNIGSNLSMNINKYYNSIMQISNQINNILTSQQMMNQMVPLNVMQQQMIMQPKMHKKNVYITDSVGRRINFIIDKDTTVKELCDKYQNKIGYRDKIKYLLMNAYSAEPIRDGQTKIKDYFKYTFDLNDTFNIVIINY